MATRMRFFNPCCIRFGIQINSLCYSVFTVHSVQSYFDPTYLSSFQNNHIIAHFIPFWNQGTAKYSNTNQNFSFAFSLSPSVWAIFSFKSNESQIRSIALYHLSNNSYFIIELENLTRFTFCGNATSYEIISNIKHRNNEERNKFSFWN